MFIREIRGLLLFNYQLTKLPNYQISLRGFAVGALGRFHQRVEAGGVIRGQVSQDLAVQLHARFLQAADELVIADALRA